MKPQPTIPTPSPQESSPLPFSHFLQKVTTIGQQLYGPHFRIHPEDHPILNKLLTYFRKDQEEAAKWKLDLRKGILLSGPVGCGKTSLMTIIRQLLPPQDQHIIKSSRDITFEFIREGFDTIQKYSTSSYQQIRGEYIPRIYCFDDLGVESNIKYYGNETNVLAEILLSRYDLFIRQHMRTHATTNLNAHELESAYGNRVRSRMREMFNLVAFNKESTDKRS